MRHIAFIALLVLSPVLQAGQVANPGDLSANDFLDWSSIGPAGTVIAAPTSFVSNSGSTINIDMPAPPNNQFLFTEVQPSTAPTQYSFSSGDFLLHFTTGSDRGVPSLRFTFAQPVYGFGTFIDVGAPTYSAQLSFNSADGGGVANVTGVSTGAPDGSAPFIGFTSTTPVTSINFYAAAGNNSANQFAIDRIELLTELPSTATPESPMLFLIGLGLLFISLLRFRRINRTN